MNLSHEKGRKKAVRKPMKDRILWHLNQHGPLTAYGLSRVIGHCSEGSVAYIRNTIETFLSDRLETKRVMRDGRPDTLYFITDDARASQFEEAPLISYGGAETLKAFQQFTYSLLETTSYFKTEWVEDPEPYLRPTVPRSRRSSSVLAD